MKTLAAIIVDHDPSARAALRRRLEDHPDIHIAAEAATLGEARQALVRRTIRLVFLEINLPGEDGFSLLSSVPPTARVIFVTADDCHLRLALDAGADGYVSKPAAPAPLAEALARGRRGLAGSPFAACAA
jgi:two-component system LytT family response regulator